MKWRARRNKHGLNALGIPAFGSMIACARQPTFIFCTLSPLFSSYTFLQADLATPSELSDTLAVCSALNTKSKVLQTTFGACALDQILPSADAAVKAACEKKDCTDPTHDHSHSHQHATAEEEAACTDPTHDHSHSSHNHAAGACTEPACNDPTHDHSHSHQHATAEEEAACTDPTHDHSHSSHNHAPSTNDADSLGISSFVYRAKRPFSESRPLSEVRRWHSESRLLSVYSIIGLCEMFKRHCRIASRARVCVYYASSPLHWLLPLLPLLV